MFLGVLLSDLGVAATVVARGVDIDLCVGFGIVGCGGVVGM